MSEQTANNGEQQGNGKEAQKFQKNFKRLVALFGGDTAFKKKKLKSDSVAIALEELVKDEKEALTAEFKKQATALIKRKQEFDALQIKLKKDMEKALEDKQKEFNAEMEKIFGLVDKIDSIESSYYNTLTQLNTDQPNATQQSGEATAANAE